MTLGMNKHSLSMQGSGGGNSIDFLQTKKCIFFFCHFLVHDFFFINS